MENWTRTVDWLTGKPKTVQKATLRVIMGDPVLYQPGVWYMVPKMFTDIGNIKWIIESYHTTYGYNLGDFILFRRIRIMIKSKMS